MFNEKGNIVNIINIYVIIKFKMNLNFIHIIYMYVTRCKY